MPWRPVVLRGTRALARCHPDGTLLDEGGRVEIRYKANDGKSYRAATRNLELTAEPVLPDEHCAEAAPVAKAVSAAPAADAKLVAYTDGACSGNPGPAGLGVVLTEHGTRRELSEYLGIGTNNVAELTAILRALEAVGRSSEPMQVHTDSQYAIGVLSKGWKAKANVQLIADIKERMRNFPRLSLVYVKGHAGIPLNERADELARAAVVARATSAWVAIGAEREQLG
ncbi:MAG TPA: ribonuclease H [Polyangiales bacterium]|nr:ribonuclease H [Polyangiales bacterium]